ncbi:MAG: hypothetical protein IB618_01905 [Candidatus Pacearchaeota archaeon]|nr:MAG: hypothetical protein IB618_01905 [Candidatus Pacearchaeota archaeon]
MIEKIKAGLEYIADFYRTAPVGETLFLMNAGPIPFTYDKPLLIGINILGSLICVHSTAKQFKLRRRLENSVSEHGYDDRAFETTILDWCDRQTARVVTKNCGNLDDYVALCDTNRERMSLANLRHF